MKSFLLSAVFMFGLTAKAADPMTTTSMDPKKMEMMKAFQKAATPGKQHKMLSDLAGNWTYKSKFWETATSKPEESTGTSSIKMILGGRFMQQEVKGTAMGMPFEGMGLAGYDNVTNKFESLWFDTMGTGVMKGEGSYNASTKTITDKGTFNCPIQKGPKEYRSEWKLTDKNNMTFALYGPGMEDPKEFKMMELVYKRVQ